MRKKPSLSTALAAHAGDVRGDEKEKKRKCGNHSRTQPPHPPHPQQESTSDATDTGTGRGSTDPIESWTESSGQGELVPCPRSGLFGGPMRAIDADGRFIFPPTAAPTSFARHRPNDETPSDGEELVCLQCRMRGHLATGDTQTTVSEVPRAPARSGISLCGDRHITDTLPPPDDWPRFASSEAVPQRHESVRRVLLSCIEHGDQHADLAWL